MSIMSSISSTNRVQIFLTVASGFEKIVKEECKEKLGVLGQTERGHVLIEVDCVQIENVLKLKGVDRVYYVIYPETKVEYPHSEELTEFFKDISKKIDWDSSLKTWCIISHQKFNNVYPNTISGIDLSSAKPVSIDPKTFTFKVDCDRKGKTHRFTSKEAAAAFGSVICEQFQWNVNLKNSDLVIFASIKDDNISIKIPLTTKSLHRRNIVNLGPTSLRNTICYNMLRMCLIKPGDMVCDIMCGGSSIPIEGASNWNDSFYICGDNHSKAIERSTENISHIRNSHPSLGVLQLLQWDAGHLPVRDNLLDVIVTDMPFGKRMGSRCENAKLYPLILKEAARVSIVGVGRALFMTTDLTSFNLALQKHKNWWKLIQRFPINLGGLSPTLYLLRRSNMDYSTILRDS